MKDEYEKKSTDEIAIFISHGEFDPIFPLDTGKENYNFFSKRSRNVSFTSYPTGHEVSMQNKNDMIKWLYER